MNNLLNNKTPAEGVAQTRKADYNLSNHGVANLRLAYWNLSTEALYEEAIFRGEGATAVGGPFTANTGKHTARSANDKFVVRETDSEKWACYGAGARMFSWSANPRYHCIVSTCTRQPRPETVLPT